MVEFCVFEMTSHDAIIGLPTILQYFHILFKGMIDASIRLIENHFPVTPLPWLKDGEEEDNLLPFQQHSQLFDKQLMLLYDIEEIIKN